MMKAAVFHGPPGSWPEKPIAIEEVPRPAPGPKDVLIKVAACGLCHTDLTYLQGAPMPKAPPIILGHEPSGIVTEVGAEVKSIEPGQRVMISTIIPCLSCSFCRSGQENLCANAVVVGATQDGAFAEYVAAPATGVYLLPDSLPLEESCIISDAVCTSYHAVYQVANVRPGDTVAVYGASGGVGLICVCLASAIGATVIGIGRKKWKLEKAREFGASETICSEEVEQLDRTVRRITGGGADISIDATGVPVMIETAFRSTKPGGKIVVVGLTFRKIQLDINRLTWLELKVMGSRTFNPVDIPKVFELVEKGVVSLDKIISHRFKLEEINKGYKMLDRGELLRGIVIP